MAGRRPVDRGGFAHVTGNRLVSHIEQQEGESRPLQRFYDRQRPKGILDVEKGRALAEPGIKIVRNGTDELVQLEAIHQADHSRRHHQRQHERRPKARTPPQQRRKEDGEGQAEHAFEQRSQNAKS